MTDMVDLDDFFQFVLPKVPDAPDPIVLAALRRATRRLCKECKVWKENETSEITLPDATAAPTVAGANIVEIIHGRIGDHGLEPRNVLWLDSHYPNWREDTDEGTARYITQLQPDLMTLWPREQGTLSVRLTLMPSLTSTEVPQFLLDHYGELLGDAAAGHALLTPNEPYTNPSLGSGLLNEFETEITRIKTEAVKGQMGAPIRSTGSFF